MKKLIAAASLALVAAACAKGVTPGVTARRADGSKSPTAGAPTGALQSPTPAAQAPATQNLPATTQVKIYYLVSFGSKFHLAPERHRVKKTQAIAKAALEELVHGTAQDPDHSTPYPRSANINAVTIRDAVATVDWSAAVLEASVGPEVESLGIQSVVYTLTEFSSIEKVRFTVEGKDRGTASNGRAIEDWWGHVGLSGQPWDREPAIEVLEPVTLYTPHHGSSSNGVLKLSGEASVFEGNVGIVLRNASGKVVVRTSAQTTGAPERGDWEKTITFVPPAAPQVWTLQIIEDSAKDGSVVFMEDRAIRVG